MTKTETNSPEWAAPTAADAAPTWRSGNAWMAGDSVYIQDAAIPTRIPFNEIDNILITEESRRQTPTWAVGSASSEYSSS
jgi:hypothetical protein